MSSISSTQGGDYSEARRLFVDSLQQSHSSCSDDDSGGDNWDRNDPRLRQPSQAQLKEPSSSDEDDDDEAALLLVPSAKKHYKDSNGNKRILLAMCVGLVHEDGKELGDITVEPYLSSVEKRTFKPAKQDLKREIIRRYKAERKSTKEPRPNHWNLELSTEWLRKYPVENSADKDFIFAEEKKYRDILAAAANERNQLRGGNLTGSTGVVFTNIADLRLISVLMHDKVKEAFIKRHDVLDRQELDARNSPERQLLWNELAARLYNNQNFHPYSEVIPDLHEDFAESHDLGLQQVPTKISPDQVKSWVGDRKTNLVLMITAWERSGNGTGNRTEDEDNFGHLEEGIFKMTTVKFFGKVPVVVVVFLASSRRP